MVKLEEYKHDTENKPVEVLPLPQKAYIPLSQHLGKPCSPLVKVGDSVGLGQKIAVSEAGVSSCVHASICGKVIAIRDWPHPVLGRCKTIIIEGDGTDRLPFTVYRLPDEINNLTPQQIRDIVQEAGIVGMGGAGFPTHIKLNPPKPIDTLIINGAECEPYLTSDYRLMVEKTNEIFKSIELVKRCLGAKEVYVAIEEDKPEAIKAFTVYRLPFTVKILKSFYPQGGEKQLIKNILGKEVPRGKLPFDVGVVVQNVATVFAIYEAVYLHKPLYERVVTVTGSCVSRPKNLLVRIGTPIKDSLAYCSLKEEPAKIIIGGPMMGISQYTEEVPIIKCSGGVILFNKKEAEMSEEEFCIRCGACVRECPIGLMPCLISLASERSMWKEAKSYGVADCIECGLCSYVCPANRLLVQSIKRAKLEVAKL
jgi:electron transport complex protein RnfC